MKKARIQYAKTVTAKAVNTAKHADQADQADTSSFTKLLQQELRPQPQVVHGVVIGKILLANNDGSFQISLDAVGIAQAQASAACLPGLLASGMPIAVMFMQGDPSRPFIIGPMHEENPTSGICSASAAATAPPLEIIPQDTAASTELLIDQERVQIHAKQELELRCGDAAIILTSDGRILLRGVYISSQASATQRLLAGSVQIN